MSNVIELPKPCDRDRITFAVEQFVREHRQQIDDTVSEAISRASILIDDSAVYVATYQRIEELGVYGAVVSELGGLPDLEGSLIGAIEEDTFGAGHKISSAAVESREAELAEQHGTVPWSWRRPDFTH